ncbi:MAG TPA: hypothetical protein VHQ64_12640 [Pyrinomonadaceae bacterium]|jgi:hypothetical protein|nr:hypothetical protein [Pyrinomonadaceae bacterium]
MNSSSIIAIAGFFGLAVLVAVIALVWMAVRNRRTTQLKSRFGPEYRRIAHAEGDAAQAESILLAREKRVKKLDIKPLTDSQRTEFADMWEHAQSEFVDDPVAAVNHADVLVQEVMSVRGYPVADFEQRVADVSVDHPAVVQNYRLAHDIAERNDTEGVGMEKLREAMLHYRALFADLLHDGGLQPVRQVRRVA